MENPEIVSNSHAIICGSRAHLEKEAIATRSAFRNLLMHGFHFLVWFFTVSIFVNKNSFKYALVNKCIAISGTISEGHPMWLQTPDQKICQDMFQLTSC